MLGSILRHLLKDFLILVVLLAATVVLPLAAFPLCRTPWGAQLVWWCGPWTCAVWVLLIVQLGSCRFWRGRDYVLAHREAHGGLLGISIRGTCWMFLGLILSYGVETAVVLTLPPSPSLIHMFPVFTYSPVLLAVWRAYRG